MGFQRVQKSGFSRSSFLTGYSRQGNRNPVNGTHGSGSRCQSGKEMPWGLYVCGFSLSVEHANTCLGRLHYLWCFLFVLQWSGPCNTLQLPRRQQLRESFRMTRGSKLAPVSMESIVFANSPLAEYLEGLYRMLP